MNKLIVFACLLLLPSIGFAYIDPGSGSAIMSAIIGFFVAIGLAVKTYWYKIKSLFTKGKNKESKKQDSDNDGKHK